ncbi:MAG: hypothetical protein M1831_005170 [Alyxoria varia]|nr:MAG: hypothetical protein M1831_005170 [Alyxoria varia]
MARLSAAFAPPSNRNSLASNSHLTPRTPSTTASPVRSSNKPEQKSTTTTTSASGNTSRKRTRNEGPGAHDYSSPYSSRQYGGDSGRDLSMSGMSTATPPPLANSRYRLAGGLDTPIASANAAFESIGPSSEPDFRQRMGSSLDSYKAGGGGERRPLMGGAVSGGGLERERNGGRQLEPAAKVEQGQDNATWPWYFIKMAGGIAGAMWDFWHHSTSTFTGFKAGGGPSYNIMEQHDGTSSMQPHNQQMDHTSPFHSRREEDERKAPRPFPLDDDYEVISHPADTDDPSDRRSSKRLQTSQAGDWVVLEHSNNGRTHTPDSQSQTSRRSTTYRSRPSTTATAARTSLPRSTGASRANIVARKSRLPHGTNAAGRISSASLHGPASSPQQAQHQQIRNSDERRASTAIAPRSPAHAHTVSPKRAGQEPAAQQKESPASADIQRYTAKREKLERQNDKSIRKLNSRLVDMINEGRQALGTRVEVEDSGEEDEMDVDVDRGGGWDGADGGLAHGTERRSVSIPGEFGDPFVGSRREMGTGVRRSGVRAV